MKQYPRWIAIEVLGMFIELSIVGLSITLVCFLQMRFYLKFVVVGAFFCRVLCVYLLSLPANQLMNYISVIIPAIVRLYYIRPSFNIADPTFNNVYPLMLTQVAMHYGLIAASIPCLKPFIRPFDAGYVGDTVEGYAELSSPNGMFPIRRRSSSNGSDVVLNSVHTGESNTKGIVEKSRKKSKIGLSGFWGGNAKQADMEKSIGLEPQTSNGRATSISRVETRTSRGVTVHTPGSQPLGPDLGEMITVVEHSPHPDPSVLLRHPSEGGDMVITRTKEYEVRYEKVDQST